MLLSSCFFRHRTLQMSFLIYRIQILNKIKTEREYSETYTGSIHYRYKLQNCCRTGVHITLASNMMTPKWFRKFIPKQQLYSPSILSESLIKKKHTHQYYKDFHSHHLDSKCIRSLNVICEAERKGYAAHATRSTFPL